MVVKLQRTSIESLELHIRTMTLMLNTFRIMKSAIEQTISIVMLLTKPQKSRTPSFELRARPSTATGQESSAINLLRR